jgi:hypothetical protein
MDMEAILARRFSTLNFSSIASYPHLVPQIDEWKDLLPRFYEGDNDNPIEHVLEFHALIQHLDIQHEEICMKLFMYSLQGDVHIWYHSLEPSIISSLKDFHAVFNIHCQKFYSFELICHSCCEEYKDYVQDIIDSYEGHVIMKNMPQMRNLFFLFDVHLHQMKILFVVLIRKM